MNVDLYMTTGQGVECLMKEGEGAKHNKIGLMHILQCHRHHVKHKIRQKIDSAHKMTDLDTIFKLYIQVVVVNKYIKVVHVVQRIFLILGHDHM
jgi:hypothetical protein